jgi:CheY-like chemotaxis protein
VGAYRVLGGGGGGGVPSRGGDAGRRGVFDGLCPRSVSAGWDAAGHAVVHAVGRSVPLSGSKWAKRARGGRGALRLSGVPGVSGRVLVVDDSKVIRQLIRVNLELEGFEVVTAVDGAECLEMVRHVRPDVVTLDVVMPRLDGLRTAARLRADPLTRDLPIAIVSACSQLDLERGEAAGIDAYLAKPFEPVELVRLVRQLMHTGTEGHPAQSAGSG